MKKKKPVKVKPQSQRKTKEETVSLETPPFHEFFPITLSYKEGKESKVCYFVCQEHLKKYLDRYKIKKGSYSVTKTKPRKVEDE